ncbi:RHS repeat protein [Pantoea sp. App145]|uniref:RHS repeat protein n=1 Tax=Pantoea sp. App145 TaxID=3071567 RepID=UPI003A7FD2A2
MNPTVCSNTPSVTVTDPRGGTIRDISWCRHPDTLQNTELRITNHRLDARGAMVASADPRMGKAGLTNFSWLTDLAGNALRRQSVDAGITLHLHDAAGRLLMMVSGISTDSKGTQNLNQALTRTFRYESTSQPGRPLSITEQVSGRAAHVMERFVYAGNSQQECEHNVAGLCVSHYDPAGLQQMEDVALTGTPIIVSRRLIRDADNPDYVTDWQGEDTTAWNDFLESGLHSTRTLADASGAVLRFTDAQSNSQRLSYDVAGRMNGSWLTVKGGNEQIIVQSIVYTAAGQKQREEHGNGVVTLYMYEPETQRLLGMTALRLADTKIMQALRWYYDPVGNVTQVVNDAEETGFWRNQKVVPENTYTYDSLYQLVKATGREMADAARQSSRLPSATVPLPGDSTVYTNFIEIYSYDSAGNLTQMRHSAPATNNNYTTDITVSDRSNRGILSTVGNNAAEVDGLFTAGGQQIWLQPGQGLSWTPRGELLKATPVMRDGAADDRESYRYDASSQRILKVNTQKVGGSTQLQRVVYLPGLELRTTERDGKVTEQLQVMTPGEAGRAQLRVLHWESGQPEGSGENDGLRWSYDDLTGSCGLELDGKGQIISREEYYPYGGTAVLTSRSQREVAYRTVRYSGKERDATGLYYYGYRYYQPWVGRWLSADPAGAVDGLNLFRMVRNNPMTLRDHDGLAPETEAQKRARYLSELQDYDYRIETILSEIKKIHNVVDAINEPDKAIKLLGKSAAGLMVKTTANAGIAAAGGAVGSALGGATLGTIALPGIGTILGATIGATIGATLATNVASRPIKKLLFKLKIKTSRLQTSKANTAMNRVDDHELVADTKNWIQENLGKDSTKTHGYALVKKGIKEAISVSLPVEGGVNGILLAKELGSGITLAKQEKIMDTMDRMQRMLPPELHEEMVKKWNYLNSDQSQPLFNKDRMKKKGITNTLLQGSIWDEKMKIKLMGEIRNDIMVRCSDIFRMMQNSNKWAVQ